MATVQSFVKNMLTDPNLSWRVVSIQHAKAAGMAEVKVAITSPQGAQNLLFYVTPDGKYAIAGELIPFGADPFAETRQEIAKYAKGPSRGPASSSLTLVEFADMECPSCKAAAPVMERLAQDFPDAHFIFQNFPLEQLHPWAFTAALYGDCVAQQNQAAFWKFLQSVFDNQESITVANAGSKLKDLAGASGVDPAKVVACVGQPAAKTHVLASQSLAKSLGVMATPTLFVNGRPIASVLSMPYEQLNQVVEQARQAK
jgi:protein-disulfide isomerase